MMIPQQLTAEQHELLVDALLEAIEEDRWDQQYKAKMALNAQTHLLYATHMSDPDVQECFVRNIVDEFVSKSHTREVVYVP